MTSVEQTILSRLNQLNIKPSKGLGQNFLIDSGAYDKIVDAAELKEGETVLEIGPGLGTLTERIAEKGVKIFAVEKDRKLIKFLENPSNFGLTKSKDMVKIVERDALKFNPTELGLKDGEYKIIANIPYYITGQLLRNIFELWPRPSLVVLLLQKEVAQRIMEKPPHANILSLSVQYFAEPKIISYISKHNFYPSPKVDSAIIRLEVRGEGLEAREEQKKLFRVIKIGFSSKRKKLINNLLAGFNPALLHKSGARRSKEEISDILKKVGIAENVRPENLTLDQWQKLVEPLSFHT